MNVRGNATSADEVGEQSPKADERPSVMLEAFGADDSRGVYATQSRLPIGLAILITALFWAAHFAINTAQVHLGPPNPDPFLVPRGISAATGALISFGMLVVLHRLRGRSLTTRAIAAVVLALVGTAALSAMNYLIFSPYFPDGIGPFPVIFEFHFLTRLWTVVAISSAFLSLSYVLDVRERENQILRLQALAHSSQVRALRNQLNPHFIFNALNSVAGLMSARRVDEAQAMTVNLADFLRLALAQDPQKLITLDEELKLQSLYLEIEQVRFPDRLKVTVDVPPNLKEALVPGLITQPLVENSIKYAVARSTQPVELRIDARQAGDRLELIIADNGGNAAGSPASGAKVGLQNVAERLLTHFGDRCSFTASANPAGGFQNTISIPLEVRK